MVRKALAVLELHTEYILFSSDVYVKKKLHNDNFNVRVKTQ